MCGIVGGIGYSREVIKKATDTMFKRGPDDQGIWHSEDVVFGHRRLSIVDLSSNGRQPMSDPLNRVVITFNGEIFNFHELREELEHSYQFRTNTDTEVLIAGYLAWGFEVLLSRIRGMYAFGLWDKRFETLYVARDRFGKKPLYYTALGQKFLFASTMQAILSCLERTPNISYRSLDDYLTYLAVPGEASIFEGVFKLLPGYYAIFRNGELSTHRYWNLSFANQLKISEDEALDHIDTLLRQAVRRRLVGEVELGAFLSGGVDSSLITAIMAQESGTKITTLTMGFEDAQFDERRFARMVSNQYQTVHHETVMTSDLWRRIPQMATEFGEPFADSSALPTYFIAEFSKRYVAVVLNGDGGDELFAGYTRPLVEAMATHYRRLVPKIVRDAIGAYANSREKLSPRILNGIRQILIAGRTNSREAFVFDRALRSYRGQLYTDHFLSQLQGHHPDLWYQRMWDESDASTSVDRAMYGDVVTYLPDELLPKMDTMTMAHSLEARSPFLDSDLAEFVARLPYSLKVQGMDTKSLLKKLAKRYVPEEVLYRPKKGFNMPHSKWLRTVLAFPMKELLLGPTACQRGLFRTQEVRRLVDSHISGHRDYGQQLWSLFMLEIWFQIHLDKVPLPLDEVLTSPLRGGVAL